MECVHPTAWWPTGTGDRYRVEVNDYSRWTGHYGRYEEIDGMKVPTEVEAVWNLSSGDLPYARFKVTDLSYDDLMIYESD